MKSNGYSQLHQKEDQEEIELQPLPLEEGEKDAFVQKEEEEATSALHKKEEIQLHRLRNLAMPLNYFFVGLVQGLAYPLLNVYSLDLKATEAQQLTLLTLKGLPSCFKIVFGAWSDNVPICGYRRKPYLWIGWMLSMASLTPLLITNDLTLDRTEEDTQVPPNAPTMGKLSSCFFLWACGVWLTDVMGDSLVAEKAKYEPAETRGDLQVLCYIFRGLGFALLSPISSLVYSDYEQGPFLIILATTLAPILYAPFLYAFYEPKNRKVLSTREQLAEMWKTVCCRAVWQPMGFLYLYLTLQVKNSAWKQFLETVLGFTPNQLNALLIIAGALMFCGVVLYKLVLHQFSWRTLYCIGLGLNGLFSAAQLLLIHGKLPFGLSPFWFALGDDALKDMLLGTQYLPMCVMMVNLVPTGIEGASYALFTTTWNAAEALADSLSTMLLGVWNVSKETLEAGELSGLVQLTLLTSGLQTLPVLLVWLLPQSVAELQQMKTGREGAASGIGGAIFLAVVLLSVGWAIFVGIMNIFHPGWIGES